MHQHNVGIPFGEKLALRDGVTTPLELEAGVYPVDEFYAALEGKSRTNYGASVGSLAVRETILNPEYRTTFSGFFIWDLLGDPQDSKASMHWSTDVSTPEQVEKFEQMMEEGLRQGSIGVGHAVGYAVAGCSQEESIIVQKLAGKYGQSSFIHGRFSGQMPPTSGLMGFLEMMAPQEVYGGGIVFQHMSAQALKDTMSGLALFDAAREKGIQVLGELYPYNYGASIVGADYLHPDNYQNNMGRDYKDIIETANLKPLTKERYEELLKANPFTSIMFYNATDEDVHKGLAHPSVCHRQRRLPLHHSRERQAGDRLGRALRCGQRPSARRRLARTGCSPWVRDEEGRHPALARGLEDDLPDRPTTWKQNGVPQMADKGRIQEGKDADITIFDPKTVQDNATMKDGGLPSTGIPLRPWSTVPWSSGTPKRWTTSSRAKPITRLGNGGSDDRLDSWNEQKDTVTWQIKPDADSRHHHRRVPRRRQDDAAQLPI